MVTVASIAIYAATAAPCILLPNTANITATSRLPQNKKYKYQDTKPPRIAPSRELQLPTRVDSLHYATLQLLLQLLKGSRNTYRIRRHAFRRMEEMHHALYLIDGTKSGGAGVMLYSASSGGGMLSNFRMSTSSLLYSSNWTNWDHNSVRRDNLESHLPLTNWWLVRRALKRA